MNFKKIYLLCLLYMFVYTNIKSQTAYIDSLKNELLIHTKEDTTRVRILNDMIYEVQFFELSNTDSLIQEAEYLIDKLNFKSGKAQLYYYKNFYNIIDSDYLKAIENCKESVKLNEALNNKRGMALSLNSIGIAYDYLDDAPNAIIYYEKAAVLFKEIDSKVGVAASLDNIGNIYANQGNFNEALNNYFKSKEIKESIDDSVGLALVYNNIGSIYAEQSDYPRALENFKECLSIRENLNDESQKYTVLGNLAYIYTRQQNYDNALLYYNLGLEKSRKRGDKFEIAKYLNGIASVYKEQNKNKKALLIFEETLEINKSINVQKELSESLINIAEVQLIFKNDIIALDYYNQALNINKEINSPIGECRSYLGLAKTYVYKNKYQGALDFALKAKKIATQFEFIEHQRDANELLSIIYENMGNYNAALESHQQFKILNDSLFNKENIEKITQLEYEYKYKQELELASYKEQQLTNTVKQTTQDLEKSQRNLLLGVIAFLVSILILGFIIFFMRLKNVKSEAENILIEQRLLRSQMTPHFIFNSLSVLQGMILNKEDKKAVSYLSKFSRLLRITLENSRDKTVALTQELAAVENYLALQNIEDSNTINYKITVDDNIDSDSFNIPPMLIQPFIENATEHAFEGISKDKKIDIHLSFSNKKLTCTIVDNGKGIAATKEKVSQNKKSLATAITSERLKLLSKDFKMEASISVEDRNKYNEKGTIITLVIPYKTELNL